MDIRLLQDRIAELEAQVASFVAQIEQLEQSNRVLQQQLDEAQRAAARQAAPFRRPERKKIPEAQKKRPGRQRGHPIGIKLSHTPTTTGR